MPQFILLSSQVNNSLAHQECPCIDSAKPARFARANLRGRAEEIVKFRRVVGSDWLEYIYNVVGLQVGRNTLTKVWSGSIKFKIGQTCRNVGCVVLVEGSKKRMVAA